MSGRDCMRIMPIHAVVRQLSALVAIAATARELHGEGERSELEKGGPTAYSNWTDCAGRGNAGIMHASGGHVMHGVAAEKL